MGHAGWPRRLQVQAATDGCAAQLADRGGGRRPRLRRALVGGALDVGRSRKSSQRVKEGRIAYDSL